MIWLDILLFFVCCGIVVGLFSFKNRLLGLEEQNKKSLDIIGLFFNQNKTDVSTSTTDILNAINEIKKTENKTEEVKIMLQNSMNLLAENADLKERQKEYYQFFGIVIQTLNEDTEFLRGNLVKGFSMDIPQVREFNSQILGFQNKILMIKEALKQQKMLEEMEEAEEKKEETT